MKNRKFTTNSIALFSIIFAIWLICPPLIVYGILAWIGVPGAVSVPTVLVFGLIWFVLTVDVSVD